MRADGDVEINGFIEGAEVISNGSIFVRGGITTGNKGIVKAAGDIVARFVDNSQIEAGGDILIGEAIMQSTVKAGGSVRVRDRKATILGGNTSFDRSRIKSIRFTTTTGTIVK